MTKYPKLDRVARHQHGLIALRQGRELGFTRRQAERFTKTGLMALVRPGIYRWCGTEPNWKMMAMAAVLAAGEPTVLSHRSAGELWGLLKGDDVTRMEITHPKARRLAGVTAHRHSLEDRERTKRFGIPVTSIERTLLDLSESCHKTELGRLIDEALRRRLTTTAKLAGALKAHSGPGRRRTAAFRTALAERGVGYDPGANDWEQRMDRLWDDWGLPTATRQHKVRLRHRTYRIDRAIVELKIGVEWNGRGTHGTRSGFDYDSDRRADLVQAGWMMLDFTTNTRPERVIKTVLKACDERRRLLMLSA